MKYKIQKNKTREERKNHKFCVKMKSLFFFVEVVNDDLFVAKKELEGKWNS